MIYCPNCGAALELEERYCPKCGAAVHTTKTRSMNIRLTRKEARRGCIRTLQYPGAPAPVRVRLPKKLRNGAVVYINDLPFLSGEGELTRGALRLRIHVKPLRLFPIIFSLLLASLCTLFVLLMNGTHVPLLSDMIQRLPIGPEITQSPEPTPIPDVSPTAQVSAVPTVQPTETPAPTPTPSLLRPLQQQASWSIPHFEQRYFLMELDDRLLENFCALYQAVASFESSCSFPQQMNRNELAQLMLLLGYECPELLQFSSATEMRYSVNAQGTVLEVELDLSLTPEAYAWQLAQCQEVAQQLALETQGLSEHEKELFAYEFITTRCTYDFNAPFSASAYGALVDGRAKCDGISLGMKWLCEEMGISCMVIAGNAPGQAIGHAWNVICIDGTYYDLDVTNDVMSEEHRIRYYGAFNVSRHWIRDRYPENLSFSGFFILPGSESMDMSYHALTGSYVPRNGDAESALFRRLEQSQPGERIFLQFESAEQYRDFLNRANEIMDRWSVQSRSSFQFTLSHLDEFQVCCISLSYL